MVQIAGILRSIRACSWRPAWSPSPHRAGSWRGGPAVILILAFAVTVAARRMLPRKPAPGGAPAIIEGEFRIEREDSPPRDRSGS